MFLLFCLWMTMLFKDADMVNTTCQADTFQCTSGICISVRWKCDNDEDCVDGSDESNCGKPNCTDTEFRCSSDRCIPERWTCDGDDDCVDGSDEGNCGSTVSSSCNNNQFRCRSGECIHKSWVCDGDADCPDRSDEACEVTCPIGQFLCPADGKCLSNSVKCDGTEQCTDGSDEFNCTCNADQFNCGDKCISRELVCDGFDDCGNSADESTDLRCGNNPCQTNNGGCEHKCVNLFRNQHKCVCFPGFRLMKGSTTVCDDIDECKDNHIHGVCSQTCINTNGSYTCECMPNYTLIDNRFCKATEARPFLLLAQRRDLLRINTETREKSVFLNSRNITSAVSIDFDYNATTVYWTDVSLQQISRVNVGADLGAKASVEVVVDNVNTPDGVAVDWINKHIYWTDAGFDRIEVASFDGKMRKTLIDTDLDEPRAIALDPNNGYIYWTDWGGVAKIERCGQNGEDREVVIQTNITWPNGLTLDYITSRLFWIDAKLHTIESSNFDGTERVTVLKSHVHLKHPFAITVFEDDLYWTDWSLDSVKKFNKFDQGDIETVVDNIQNPMGIQVFSPHKQPVLRKLCGDDNGGCTHFCLPKPLKNPEEYTPGSRHYTCACSNGFVLQADGRTCMTENNSTSIGPSFNLTTRPYVKSTSSSQTVSTTATSPLSSSTISTSSTTRLSANSVSSPSSSVISSPETGSSTSSRSSGKSSINPPSTVSPSRATGTTLSDSGIFSVVESHTPEVGRSPSSPFLNPVIVGVIIFGLLILVIVLLGVIGFLVYRISKKKRTGSATITYQNAPAPASPPVGDPDPTMYDSETVNMEVNLINN